MFSRLFVSAFLSYLLLARGVSAHPESKTPEQVKAYQDLQAAAYHCAPTIAKYTAERQRRFAEHVLGGSSPQYLLSSDNGLFDSDTYEDVGPQKLLACTPFEEQKIRNNTCVLAPEVTAGPYYETAEHPMRTNIAEYQPGLLFLINIGVIDVETCEPIPDVLVDIWHANATGHYSGHPEPAPELANEEPVKEGRRKGLLSPFPKTKWGETFCRGAYPTDKNGVTQFTSIFPGYYTGRATHVHVKVFPKWTPLDNGTFIGERLVHVGQLFVPDDLNMAVDKLWPYNTNPIAEIRGRTRNWEDSLNIFWDSQKGGYHSIFETHLLGGVLQQGVIGYITMAVNMSASVSDGWHI
ncbi:Intradiol ring-cleavage dioxygenase [Cantharellus anzutake]|uniref:Intradiol ring-cleavage dioxygenase n=1 Tax=Cantharellus anzutake TaxID=1750568 RepID=UPI0019071E9A|nr:Intradiol ring-cleavage dioxygenase [Cantharellus anzutake]KAF8329153.1 Intradiol ring-cleavage dioxygenase [Cantharellus anzutake]